MSDSIEIDLSTFPFQEIVPELTNELHRQIQAEMELVLKQKLEEKNIHIDLDKEKIRRFKTLQRETKGNETTYWYNDGSMEGQRVVTFRQKDPEGIRDACNIEIFYEYY